MAPAELDHLLSTCGHLRRNTRGSSWRRGGTRRSPPLSQASARRSSPRPRGADPSHGPAPSALTRDSMARTAERPKRKVVRMTPASSFDDALVLPTQPFRTRQKRNGRGEQDLCPPGQLASHRERVVPGRHAMARLTGSRDRSCGADRRGLPPRCPRRSAPSSTLTTALNLVIRSGIDRPQGSPILPSPTKARHAAHTTSLSRAHVARPLALLG